MNSFHSGTSEVYKNVVIGTVLLECVYSGVFNNVSIFRVSYGPDFVCFVFPEAKCLERWTQSFPIEKVFAVFIFYRNRKIYPFPLRTRGYTEVCMLCGDVCVKWNTFETHNRRFLGVYLNKNPETSLKPRISHVKCWNCNQNMK